MNPECSYVCANIQGSNDKKCPYYHQLKDGSREKGNIIAIRDCPVKYWFFIPIINSDGIPSTNHLVIISKGIHNHPPPPLQRIAPDLRVKILNAAHDYGLPEATARKLFASSHIPIMLNGQEELTNHHLSLFNQSSINHIIRTERLKEYPFGTDFLGVQHVMTRQNPSDPYIRSATMYPDGQFMVLCQLKQQSQLLFQADELHVDKTFKRTNCQELEINVYSHESRRIGTIARVFTDSEDEIGYYRAFSLIFKTAEQDVGRKLPWGHLTPIGTAIQRIKAILVDEHGGQIKGLARYLGEENPTRTAESHILAIVKTCRVHYERSLHKLEAKGISQGSLCIQYILIIELCDKLRVLPHVTQKKVYLETLYEVQTIAESQQLTVLLNWLKHKDNNPWVLKCLSRATTEMSEHDWKTTSFTTNIAESAHALSQREGKKLSLLAAIQKGKNVDHRFLLQYQATCNYGVTANYGNTFMSGRKALALTRQKAKARKIAAKNKGQSGED